MKTTKKKNIKSRRKSWVAKKPGVRLSLSRQQGTQTPLRERRAPDPEKVRLEGQVADLSKTRNHLEQELRQKSDELKIKNGELKNGINRQHRSEEQIHILTKATEATADGVFIIDVQKVDFPVVYANPAFQKMTGYGKREVLGRNYFGVYGAKADSRVVEEIKNTMRKGKSFHGEMLNFKKDAQKYWNLLRLAPVRDSRGVVTHYVGIQTDVTLMRQRDLEVKEQREEILHVTRVGKLAEFVSSLAHEISQPLTAILSYAQAAQRMLADREPEIKEIFGHIVDDDQRATEVIRRLRSLLKKGLPIREPFDINFLINETVVLIGTDVIVRNKSIETDLAADLPRILGDRIQLQQVLLNLISNSLDAMGDNPDSREMLVRTTLQDADTILVEVKDSGCGISARNTAKLFDHFFTSKPDGLGMGLSISRSIVESHGGRLEFKNNPDGGATFYFTLPVGRKDAL
ncbi:MAG TPA: ATP-binding protein [Candidatus Bathyarchaeia archaeon]|nr:ATP-binding protein [Candidatus Bathyarchaeia archaeon]